MDKILVLDFGGQYAHLIANRLRRLGVYSEIGSPNTTSKELKKYKGLILSGGPNSVYSKDAPKFNKKLFNLNLPILGICYGHQLMTRALGGKVSPGTIKEYGFAKVKTFKNKLFQGLDKTETVWMSHGDTVSKLPKGFILTASSADCAVSGMADEKRKFYGVQFHPEVTHTKKGTKILQNFIKITGAKKSWNMKKYLKEISTEIKSRSKGKNVFLLVSGGVDSTVCFTLLNELLGSKRVLGLHIDNGLMRLNESKDVEKEMRKHGFSNLHVVDSSDGFLKALSGVYKPEEKRKIIGEYFIKVYKNSVKKLNLNPKKWLLAQGTIYPDTIETGGTKHSALIKTHHNRVPMVQKMIKQGLVLEPLANLYKDEVRELGKLLKLPSSLIDRHPFPGPGLGVRCLCSDGREKSDSKSEKETKKLLVKTDYVGFISSIKSVGVQGDFRTYRHPAVIKGPLNHNKLEKISTDLTNRISAINRVLFCLHGFEMGKSGKTKKAYLTKERLELLREADSICTKIMRKHKLYAKVWQMPVVLIPYGSKYKESIVIRPIDSTEAMTARFSRLPAKVLREMARKLSKFPIDSVYFDVTNKPPATIEWE